MLHWHVRKGPGTLFGQVTGEHSSIHERLERLDRQIYGSWLVNVNWNIKLYRFGKGWWMFCFFVVLFMAGSFVFMWKWLGRAFFCKMINPKTSICRPWSTTTFSILSQAGSWLWIAHEPIADFEHCLEQGATERHGGSEGISCTEALRSKRCPGRNVLALAELQLSDLSRLFSAKKQVRGKSTRCRHRWGDSSEQKVDSPNLFQTSKPTRVAEMFLAKTVDHTFLCKLHCQTWHQSQRRKQNMFLEWSGDMSQCFDLQNSCRIWQLLQLTQDLGNGHVATVPAAPLVQAESCPKGWVLAGWFPSGLICWYM